KKVKDLQREKTDSTELFQAELRNQQQNFNERMNQNQEYNKKLLDNQKKNFANSIDQISYRNQVALKELQEYFSEDKNKFISDVQRRSHHEFEDLKTRMRDNINKMVDNYDSIIKQKNEKIEQMTLQQDAQMKMINNKHSKEVNQIIESNQ